MRGRCEGVQGGVVKGTRGWCEVVEWDGVEVNLQYSYIHHTMHKVSLLSNLQIGIPSVDQDGTASCQCTCNSSWQPGGSPGSQAEVLEGVRMYWSRESL